MVSTTDLAHCLQVNANLLLIVMHCCGAAAEFVCTRQCCAECPFGMCVLGMIEGCNMKKYLPVCNPKGCTMGV